jgi:hydrogenase maturation protease
MLSAKEEWNQSLQTFFQGASDGALDSLHLLGAGSPIRRDDGVGIYIIDQLMERFRSGSIGNILIHPSTVEPELVLSRVAVKGAGVLIFDCLEDNATPGSIMFRRLASSRFGYFATHNVPLKVYTQFLESVNDVFVLGIQPQDLEIGEGLSEPVRRSVSEVVDVVSGLIGKQMKTVKKQN